MNPPVPDAQSPEQLRFGEFRFDPRSEQLFNGDQLVDLPQLPSRALALLLARRGELVSHQQLQEALWSDRVVSFDQSLHTCIRQIRKALGDDSSCPSYVQTLPRRGYRFIAEVEQAASKPVPAQAQRWPWLAAASAALRAAASM